MQRAGGSPDTALMLVTAHADDEGIFFGGAIPYYCLVRRLPVVLICLAHSGTGTRSRELREACAAYGLSIPPEFGGFGDHGYGKDLDYLWRRWGGKQRVTGYLTRQIRRFRPAVVLCHDFDGEYGHPAHMAAGVAAAAASELAGRTDSFPEQLDTLEPWGVMKCYVHMWPGGPLWHSWDDPYSELGDLTPRQVANIGLACHRSQPEYTRFVNGKDDRYGRWPAERWGLYRTTVGPDTDPKGDFMQNIDPSQFADVTHGGEDAWGGAQPSSGLTIERGIAETNDPPPRS